MAHGDYHLRVRATSRDELGELAVAFNQMSADLGAADAHRGTEWRWADRDPRPRWWFRLWPRPEPAGPRPNVLIAAFAVGLLTALVVRFDPIGGSAAVIGAGVIAVCLLGRGRRPTAAELAVGLGVCALLAVAGLRAAPGSSPHVSWARLRQA